MLSVIKTLKANLRKYQRIIHMFAKIGNEKFLDDILVLFPTSSIIFSDYA